jgi:putative ABC transport system permease protein
MRQDLRDAFRALRRAPAFSVVAIILLALAIGSATATFSVVDAILVRGLPYANASRLQTVYERSDDGALRVPSYPTFKDWQEQSGAVRDAIDGLAFVRGDGIRVAVSGEPEQTIAAYVTPGFFQLLGTRQSAGRTFLPEEERPGGPRVAVISHDFLVRRFAGDANAALGKTITVDSMPTTIIGVMPRGFAYPNFGGIGWVAPALWQPITVFEATHAALSLRGLHVDSRALLRLRAGADSARAASAMRTIQQRLATTYPVEQAHWTAATMRPLSEELFGDLASTLVLIAVAIVLVLLLACANVANLLLVRNSVRARELAVRSALGAGAWRLARHLLVEASVIATAAGAAGAGLGVLLVRLLRPFAAGRLPFATEIAVDGRALLFAISVSIATALLIGVMPAWNSDAGDLITRLRDGQAAGTASATRRARNVLVVIQFALAITVLIGAGLLIQSVRRVSNVDLGYDTENVVGFSVFPPKGRYDKPEQAAALYRRILDATRAVPTVESSAAAGGALLPTKLEADDRSGDTGPQVAYHPISTDFLKIYRLRIIDGRGFTDDDMRSPSGFLITETLAKRLWPGATAVGHRITVHRSSQARADFGQPITMPVVGVVADYREFGAEQKPPEQVFLPFTLEVWPWMQFIVRVSPTPATLAALERAVKDVDPSIDLRGKPSALRAQAAVRFTDPRIFVMTLMSAFAATALLLAAIGLYGVVAYSVAQRTREIGVRIAIGATSRSIAALVLGQAAAFVGAGVGCGLLAAFASTKLIRAMLFETTPTDATTFVVVPLVLAAVAAIASLAPAYRATRTDPIIAIRAE